MIGPDEANVPFNYMMLMVNFNDEFSTRLNLFYKIIRIIKFLLHLRNRLQV